MTGVGRLGLDKKTAVKVSLTPRLSEILIKSQTAQISLGIDHQGVLSHFSSVDSPRRLL
jgi:hypothetical protein